MLLHCTHWLEIEFDLDLAITLETRLEIQVFITYFLGVRSFGKSYVSLYVSNNLLKMHIRYLLYWKWSFSLILITLRTNLNHVFSFPLMLLLLSLQPAWPTGTSWVYRIWGKTLINNSKCLNQGAWGNLLSNLYNGSKIHPWMMGPL